MGVWALFLLVTTLFETAKAQLLKNAHIRYAAGASDGDKTIIASSSLVLNIAVSCLFILFLTLFSDNLSNWLHIGKELTDMWHWYIPGVVAVIAFSHFEAVSQSHLDFKGTFAGYLVRQVFFFGVLVYYKVNDIPFSLVELSVYYSISIFLGAIALFFFSRKYLNFRFVPNGEWMKKLLSFGRYVFGTGLLGTLFGSVDQLLIAKFTMQSSNIASYNAATRINGIIDMPSYTAAEIMLPKVSKMMSEEGLSKMKYIYERMVGILLAFTLPVSLFIIAFPKLVILLIVGAEYLDATLILQLYMLAGILRPAQNQAANLLMSIGKARFCFIMNALNLAGMLLINYVCLRYIDNFYGAAIGTVISSFIGLIVWYYIMKKQLNVEFKNFFIYILDTYKIVFTQIRHLLNRMRSVPFFIR
jgi:lipopolysaccharide exporter